MTRGTRNTAAWQAFDMVFQPWMRRRLLVRMGAMPALPPESGAVMLVANHCSWWDGFLLRKVQQAIRPGRPLYTIALERELARHPVLRFIGGVGLTPASPGSILAAMRGLSTRIAESPDAVIGYFPQGCIAPSFRRPLAFARGVELFAHHLAPLTIIPIAIHIEPLVNAAPTAFVLAGAPQFTDFGPVSAVALECEITRLLDASLATLSVSGEKADVSWHAAFGCHPPRAGSRTSVLANRSSRELHNA